VTHRTLRDFWFPLARSRFLDEKNEDLETIDRDLDAMAHVLRLGRVRRNRMILAACLPAEILAAVFEFVKQEVYGEYEDIGDKEREGNMGDDEPKVKIMGWNTFSHVCQRWRQVRNLCHCTSRSQPSEYTASPLVLSHLPRALDGTPANFFIRVPTHLLTRVLPTQVALDFPYIWREIKFSHTGPRWAYEMLSRSKASPLHVEIGCGQHANPYFAAKDVEKFTSDLLTTHANRLHTFTVFGESILNSTAMLVAFPKYPLLKFLHIENTDATAIPTMSFPLLTERTPALRELCAIGVMLLGTPSATLDHLTYFDLQMPETPPSEPLYSWQLLDVFKCMPALQHLYITDVYPAGEPPRGLAPVEMPAPLETLTLAARQYPKELLAFSRMISHPSAFRDFEFQHAVAPELLGGLLQLHVGPARPPRSLYLEMDYANDKIVFSASFTPWAPSPDGTTPTPLNDVSVTVAHVDAHAARFLEGVCLRDVVDLTFLDDAETAGARWAQLAGARNARHLRVIGHACRPLFRMLRTDAGLFADADALSVIEMAELAPHLGTDALEGAYELAEMLEARRARGRPIRDLKVPDRLVDLEWAAPIRPMVERFGGSRPRFY
jgi:hypothetical protein